MNIAVFTSLAAFVLLFLNPGNVRHHIAIAIRFIPHLL